MRSKLLITLDRESVSFLIYCVVFFIPFIRYYDFPALGTSVETILIFLLFILVILLNRLSVNYSFLDNGLNNSRRFFSIFCVWFMGVTFAYEFFTRINASYMSSSYSLITYIVLIPTIIILLLMIDTKISIKSCIRVYSFFIKVIVVVFLLQWILFIAGIKIGFNIPLLPYTSSWSYLNKMTFGMDIRPTSLFSEPAHMCEYVLPYIAICLYSDWITHGRVKAIILSGLLISTVSGNGIVVVLIEWVLYFLFFGRLTITKKIFLCIFAIAIGIGLYRYLLSLPVFRKMFSELFVNTTGKYSETKADYRVYRGFDYYSQLPFLQKIIGVGDQHMHAFATEYQLSSKYDNNNAYEFFSTVTQILLYSGLIGLVPFILHLFYLWKSRSRLVKGLIICSVSLWFSSQMLFANTFIMYTLLIVSAYIGAED